MHNQESWGGICNMVVPSKAKYCEEVHITGRWKRDQTGFLALISPQGRLTPRFEFVSPAPFIAAQCSYSSLNQAWSEYNPTSLLNPYPVSWSGGARFCSLSGYTEIGDETGIRGSNYSPKDRVTLWITLLFSTVKFRIVMKPRKCTK
jgi:hypothetical protein